MSKFIALPVSGNLEMQSSLTMDRLALMIVRGVSKGSLAKCALRPIQKGRPPSQPGEIAILYDFDLFVLGLEALYSFHFCFL